MSVREATTARNEITLAGRLAAAAETRVLPSGDVLVVFRIVVDRPRDGRGRPAGRRSRSEDVGRTPTVDTFDCVVSTAALRRRVSGWSPGDVLEVSGSLRRRFWRGAHGVASRHEVEVARARRLARSPA